MEQSKENSSALLENVQEISLEEIKKNQQDIIDINIAIWRKNIDNKFVTVPPKKLEQYLKEEGADKYNFFIEKNWQERIKTAELKHEEEVHEDEKPDMKEVEKFGKVEEQVSIFSNMTVVEREEVLDECITKISENETDKPFDLSLVIKMVEVLCSTLYANNANLEDIVTTANQKENIHGVFVKSNWIVKLIVDIFEQKRFHYEDLSLIDEISTGSKTMDHINKVFLRFISFCIFFNEYIDKGLFTKNIRSNFKDRYLRYYKRKFSHLSISIERIFKDGVRRIEKETELVNYSLGALLFDIGKIHHITYHDSSEARDEKRVKQHVLHSYNMIIKTKQYPFEVLAMSAFHHEYYGGKAGYNFTEPVLSKLFRDKRTAKESEFFIAYEKEDFISGNSISFFPCKVLEIIDIFDAMTSKKAMPVKEALRMMKKEFIARSLMIDPVLFRIFLEYNTTCGAVSRDEIEEIDSIIL
ncbi:MAG: hypothetical protein JW864_14550 [Spirochaetes bacterium]|nr:hypothetical protein [Spirochaetota bacterium]